MNWAPEALTIGADLLTTRFVFMPHYSESKSQRRYAEANDWLVSQLDTNLWSTVPGWIIQMNGPRGIYFTFEREVDSNLIMMFKLTFA